MGVLRMLVFCALVFIIRCENTTNLQTNSSTMIDTRCKRETEIDVRSRENNIKVPYLLKPAKLMIPATKRSNLINKYPLNAIPRRNSTPVVSKPKFLNTVKDSGKNSENDHNSGNLTNNARLETNVISEPTKTINLIITDNTTKNNEESNKNKEMKEKSAQDDSELNTDKEMKCDDVKNTIEVTEADPSGVNEVAGLNEDSSNPNQGDPIEKDQILSRKLDALDPLEKLASANVSSNPNVNPETLNQTSMSDENASIKEKENNRYSKSFKTETNDKPSSLVEKDTINKEIVDKSAPKMVSLTMLSEGKKPIKIAQRINPFHVPLFTKPIKNTADETPTITQKRDESQINRSIENPELGVLDKPNEMEPEEIIIQNNNYEELFETSAQQNMPQLISSDLRSALNSNSFNRIPPYYAEVNVAYGSKSYPYEVQKYPNQYVVNVYDDIENGRRNNVESQKLMNNRDKLIDIPAKNAIPWRQQYSNYHHPQFEDFEQQTCIGKNRIQSYPKLIWKSWNNNQIFIRPKYRSIGPEFYNNLGRYIVNANGKGSPIYISNRIGYGAYENQNTSPYMNPFQYRRHGY